MFLSHIDVSLSLSLPLSLKSINKTLKSLGLGSQFCRRAQLTLLTRSPLFLGDQVLLGLRARRNSSVLLNESHVQERPLSHTQVPRRPLICQSPSLNTT